MVFFSVAATAQDEKKPYEPKIAAASDEGQTAIGAMRIPDGFKVELWAAEPDVANPVVFAIDEKGRLYVCESFRQGDQGGILDNRGHMYWLDDDLAAQTVEDRRAYMIKHNKDMVERWTAQQDRIRLLEDTDHDGKADKASVYYSGFHDLVDGSLAGVLPFNGDVFLTCIPKVYKLRDTNGDGVADKNEVLSEGYGVRFAFRGHDLHGLTMGPDGRIYFSIGDRGYNITTKEGKVLKDPGAGAVFRCELDGSKLEVFHTGLRNPQELVFDDYGNLFAGDNNSDSGDKARWVYIVEGGISGWNMAFQYLRDRGPWNREGWWHLWTPEQAAFLVPPIEHIGNGPSGETYYPGTGWNDSFKDTFFMCDFKGGANVSGVWSFKMKPRGAWFEMTDRKQFLWGTLVTDADFGYDGSLYFTDWVHGWEGLGKGRVYRLLPKEQTEKAKVEEVAKLMAEGFDQRKPEELAKLLGHADRRVRQRAQFALAAAKDSKSLLGAIEQTGNRFARIHGIWGMGQIIRNANPQTEATGLLAALARYLNDEDAEIRAQVARQYGDSAAGSTCSYLLDAYPYRDARQTFFAAIALGKTAVSAQKPKVMEKLVDLLATNKDADPYLRHAAVMGLYYLGDADALVAKAKDENRSVRLGILLALRRMHDPRIAMFLDDKDAALVTEAARAIHDQPIEKALPALAAVLDKSEIPKDEALLRRTISAAYRVGGKDNAARLAKLASLQEVSSKMRVEAMDTVLDWEGKVPRDRVLGSHLVVPQRTLEEAAPAVQSMAMPVLESGAPADVRAKAAELIAPFKVEARSDRLLAIMTNEKESAKVRSAVLDAMGATGNEKLSDAIAAGMASKDGNLRNEARKWLAKLKPADAVPVLEGVLESGATGEQQGAFATLAEMKNAASDAVLEKWLDKLIAGKVESALQLDLIEAARSRDIPRMKLKLAAWESALSKEDPLKGVRQMLAGGSADAGRKTFWEETKAQCSRCHKVQGKGAGEAGPDLHETLKKQSYNREYILESILFPNRKISEGFDTVLIETLDGEKITGVIRGDDGKTVTLVTPDNKKLTFKASDIIDKRKVKSAMPEDFAKHLSEREIRDLVEYLAGQK